MAKYQITIEVATSTSDAVAATTLDERGYLWYYWDLYHYLATVWLPSDAVRYEPLGLYRFQSSGGKPMKPQGAYPLGVFLCLREVVMKIKKIKSVSFGPEDLQRLAHLRAQLGFPQ
jgi:hypothetical protein